MKSIDLSNKADNKVFTQHCAAGLICMVADSGAENFRIQISGVTRKGREIGDWVIEVFRVPSGMMN